MLNWALTAHNCSDSSCHIHHDTQETNYTGKNEEVVLWEVSICLDLFLWRLPRLRECYQCFGQDTVVAIVGEPQWLVLIPRAAVQTTLGLGPLGGDTRRFPWESSAAIPRLPLHKVNQESCNYVRRKKLSPVLSEALPNKWVQCLVHRKQPPTASQTYNTSCLWKNLSLPHCLPPTYTQHSLKPFIILILAPGRLLPLFWDCTPFFLLFQLPVTPQADVTCSFGLQETGIVLCTVTITHQERNEGETYSAFVHFTTVIETL